MDDTRTGMSSPAAPQVSLPVPDRPEDRTEADTSRRTEAIREEIEQTRDEMAETIDAIQEKLRPRTIVANATERVKAATTERAQAMAEYAEDAAEAVVNRTRDTATGFMEQVRQNPVPAALIAVGVAWWMRNASRGRPTRRPGDRWRTDRGDRLGARTGRGYGWQEDRPGGTGELTEGMMHGGESLASRSREYARDATNRLRETGQSAQHQLQRVIDDSPLLVGAGALMLGVAFGLAVPETEQENAWMGETRDSVVDRAQEMAEEAANKVQQKATELADAAGRAGTTIAGGRQD